MSGGWTSPGVTGKAPDRPRWCFSLTLIDDHRAVLFGGKTQAKTSRDAYILDLTTMVSYLGCTITSSSILVMCTYSYAFTLTEIIHLKIINEKSEVTMKSPHRN